MPKRPYSEVVRAGEKMADILEEISMSANGYGRLIHTPDMIERMTLEAIRDWQEALDTVEKTVHLES